MHKQLAESSQSTCQALSHYAASSPAALKPAPTATITTGEPRHTIAVTSKPASPKSDATVWTAGTAGLRFTRPEAAAASAEAAAADVSISGAATQTGQKA